MKSLYRIKMKLLQEITVFLDDRSIDKCVGYSDSSFSRLRVNMLE